jgi:hypothetical protein
LVGKIKGKIKKSVILKFHWDKHQAIDFLIFKN